MLRKFIEETPALVSIVVLPTILWTAIFGIPRYRRMERIRSIFNIERYG